MEDKQSHPIPQDVTGFQFRLIGDMTIKQFAYLAGPVFLAWLFFQLTVPIIIKIPVSIVLGGIGAALAFIPIAGRPMDAMIINFVKALLKPTLYVYQKGGAQSFTPTVTLPSQKTSIRESEVQKPTMLQAIPQIIPVHSLPNAQIITKRPVLQQAVKKDHPRRDRKENLLKISPNPEKKQQVPKEQKQPQTESGFQEQLQTALDQKDQLTKQLLTLQQKLDAQKENLFTPSLAEAPPTEKPKARPQTQNVRQVPKALGKSVGLPVAPEAPNIATGIVKDPRGNPLGNILVEIKDNEGNPVRAFKTNGLGQFASATPLTRGTYTVSFDDPKGQNKFDAIEFTANGEIILPLEVISIDTREELRKTLFKES